MIISILTLFPKIFDSIFSESIVKRAADKNLVKINVVNIRDFAGDKHKTVDDKPFGGGHGMVLKIDVIARALESIKPKPYVILLSASGRKFNQKIAKKMSKETNLALICGHYEGVDARVEKLADKILSIGDFILTGGEIPAMAIVDSIVRFIPGSINPASPVDESFEAGLLEYPQYTRPQIYKGMKVPKVLLLGNHSKITKWRKSQSVKRTKKLRPDLLKRRK